MKNVKPPLDLSVCEWADKYRYLSSEASAEAGRFNSDRAPYQKGILDAFSDKSVETVVVMTSAQIGKTEILNNVIGYFCHIDPSPMLVVQPTLEMAQAWSKDRLDPMFRDTPVLKDVFSNKSRIGENTILHKRFVGGHVTVSGSNSPSSLASRPVRVVMLDEVDRYDRSAGTEGDPAKLAIKRSTTFQNRKIGMFSTPTNKGASRIHESYEGSDQRKFYVPCPHCNEYQHLEWGQVAWPSADEVAKTSYVCIENGCVIENSDKMTMLRAGEWRASKPFNGVAGFHINELYSPWVQWSTIAQNFLDTYKFPDQFKVFVNTSLAELWDDEQAGDGIDPDVVSQRTETYNAQVPNGIYLLTAAVDVQDDRLEVEVLGWGLDEENWSIDYFILHGNPAGNELWRELDDILETEFDHEAGGRMGIKCACIDSGGHHTDSVYAYCKIKAAQKKRVFAVKGSSQRNQPIVIKYSRNNSHKVKVFLLGVDTAKETIYARLNKITSPGAGYFHHPSHYDDEYFNQLTAEKKIETFRKGRPITEWVKPASRRNEALDLKVYNFAAYRILKPDMAKVKERFDEALKRRGSELAKNSDNKGEQLNKPRRSARPRGGFVKGFK